MAQGCGLYARLIAVIALLTVSAHAEQPPTTQAAPSEFVRFREDGRGGGRLETAIASYVNDAGVRVDLLSAVHVAEPAFYRAISDRFPRYDAVAYELIGPEMIVPMDAGASDAQAFLASQGGLQNQADGINYHRKNFVHADLSEEAIARLEKKSNSFWAGIGEGLSQAFTQTDEEQVMGLAIVGDMISSRTASKPEKIRLMPRALGRAMALSWRPQPGQYYPAGMDVTIGARNERAMEVVDQQLVKGDRLIGVFYGAGHMPDMERRLLERGFHLKSTEWLNAWSVEPDGTPTTRRARP
jgi:hypothetical protein